MLFLVVDKFWQVFNLAVVFVGMIVLVKAVLEKILQKVLAELPFTDVAQRARVVADAVDNFAGKPMVGMPKYNLFNKIFLKNLMKTRAAQKSIKALKIRVAQDKVIVGNKVQSNDDRSLQLG